MVDKETLIAKYARYIAEDAGDKADIKEALADFAEEIIGLTIKALLAEEEE